LNYRAIGEVNPICVPAAAWYVRIYAGTEQAGLQYPDYTGRGLRGEREMGIRKT